MSAIGKYLWWLLPGFLKKKGQVDPQGSITRQLTTIHGEALDEFKAEILSMRDQHAVETAAVEHLDQLGEERETQRLPGELDDDYRQRIFAAIGSKQKVGTIPYMQQLLDATGLGCEITEVWTFDREHWAEFIVHLWDAGTPILITQDELYRQVNRARPAHARAVYQVYLPLRTFDAWDFSLEEGLTFHERIQAIRATGEHLFDTASAFDTWDLP